MVFEMSGDEKKVLEHVLEFYLGEMRKEVVKTDDSELKQSLHEEEKVVKKLIEKLAIAGVTEKGELSRIEDFIALAKEGKDVAMAIDLKKQFVAQKVHPSETEEMKSDVDMYILIGNYTFKFMTDVKQISKVYVYGSAEESMNDARVNKNIANERLKMDYKRLMEANIIFEEKYF